MKPELFNELLESIHEAGAVMVGKGQAHRETHLELPDVNASYIEFYFTDKQFHAIYPPRE